MLKNQPVLSEGDAADRNGAGWTGADFPQKSVSCEKRGYWSAGKIILH